MRLLIRLTLVVALLLFTAPLAAGAQAGKILRIGFLTPGVVEAGNPSIVAFQQRLRELGYIERQNVALEFRSANGRVERYPGIAAELVRLEVDVIVAVTNRAIEAAQKATTSIPIVMNQATDPVATGLVASLARPGGNITGLTIQTPDLAGKGLQLLKEAVPTLSRVAVLSDPRYPGGRQILTEVEAAATVLGLKLQLVEVRSRGELEDAFAARLVADAQPAGKVHQIGYLTSGSATATPRTVEAFRRSLRELGWVEGQNIVINYRFAEFDRLPDLVADLVRLQVEVIVAGPKPAAGIIGCPHEEGVDYPEGQKCGACPYWADRDRWTGKVIR